MKYKTYEELFDAYKTGEIPPDAHFFLDNDDSFVCIEEEMVFQGNGECDTFEILKAIGIPVEMV